MFFNGDIFKLSYFDNLFLNNVILLFFLKKNLLIKKIPNKILKLSFQKERQPHDARVKILALMLNDVAWNIVFLFLFLPIIFLQ
jgi:hypothetical protein